MNNAEAFLRTQRTVKKALETNDAEWRGTIEEINRQQQLIMEWAVECQLIKHRHVAEYVDGEYPMPETCSNDCGDCPYASIIQRLDNYGLAQAIYAQENEEDD